MDRYDRVSEGMSRAFKRRARPCPVCGRKTIQSKRSGPHVCAWKRLHPPVTAAHQLAEWVAGRPTCPNDRGECCPDFSCCRPALLWPAEKRRAFAAAGQPERERMLLGALGDMLKASGNRLA